LFTPPAPRHLHGSAAHFGDRLAASELPYRRTFEKLAIDL
jgi:hypothetical protein